MAKATTLFSASRDVVKTVVFLSDGEDTSSNCEVDCAIKLANEREVQLYALGVNVKDSDKSTLRNAAWETGGFYIDVKNFTTLAGEMRQIVRNLQGQYKVNYISLLPINRSVNYEVGLRLRLREC